METKKRSIATAEDKAWKKPGATTAETSHAEDKTSGAWGNS